MYIYEQMMKKILQNCYLHIQNLDKENTTHLTVVHLLFISGGT